MAKKKPSELGWKQMEKIQRNGTEIQTYQQLWCFSHVLLHSNAGQSIEFGNHFTANDGNGNYVKKYSDFDLYPKYTEKIVFMPKFWILWRVETGRKTLHQFVKKKFEEKIE